eukprot:gene12453-biopygen2206
MGAARAGGGRGAAPDQGPSRACACPRSAVPLAQCERGGSRGLPRFPSIPPFAHTVTSSWRGAHTRRPRSPRCGAGRGGGSTSSQAGRRRAFGGRPHRPANSMRWRRVRPGLRRGSSASVELPSMHGMCFCWRKCPHAAWRCQSQRNRPSRIAAVPRTPPPALAVGGGPGPASLRARRAPAARRGSPLRPRPPAPTPPPGGYTAEPRGPPPPRRRAQPALTAPPNRAPPAAGAPARRPRALLMAGGWGWVLLGCRPIPGQESELVERCAGSRARSGVPRGALPRAAGDADAAGARWLRGRRHSGYILRPLGSFPAVALPWRCRGVAVAGTDALRASCGRSRGSRSAAPPDGCPRPPITTRAPDL